MTDRESPVFPNADIWEEILNREGKVKVVASLNHFLANLLEVSEVEVQLSEQFEPKDKNYAMILYLLDVRGAYESDTNILRLDRLFDEEDGHNSYAHELAHTFIHTHNSKFLQVWEGVKRAMEESLGQVRQADTKVTAASGFFLNCLACKSYEESVATFLGFATGRKSFAEDEESARIVRQLYFEVKRRLLRADRVLSLCRSEDERMRMMVEGMIVADSLATVTAHSFTHYLREKSSEVDLKRLFFADPMLFNREVIENFVQLADEGEAADVILSNLKKVSNG